MRLSISNIGWEKDDDLRVFALMNKYGFEGLEIAPTRVFPDTPYEDLDAAKEWSKTIHSKYGFTISSIQSIWYGKTEKVFGDNVEKEILINYTKKAIDFSEAIGCRNLVFGCPRNRLMPDGAKETDALSFFKQIGSYASMHNCVVAIEANPRIYNTNFLNTTKQAVDFIKKVNSNGLMLNLDVGTMIENKENISVISENFSLVHHIHISEPCLRIIEKRDLHIELADLLKKKKYDGYVSIEVGKQDDPELLASMMEYLSDIFI